MDEDDDGSPELLLALLPATAMWASVCALGWFWTELSSRSNSGVMKGAMPIPKFLRLISSTGAGKIMWLFIEAALALIPAGMLASNPCGIPAMF